MEFNYTAIDNSGSRHQGVLEASSKIEAQKQLKLEGLVPIALKPVSSGLTLDIIFESKVTLDQLEFFTSELSLLLESGVRVDKGIDIIRQSNVHPALTRLLNQLATSLKKGTSLSDAFAQHKELFGP